MKGKNIFGVLAVLLITLATLASSVMAATPVISMPSSQTVSEGQLLTFTVTATDASGHTMVFSTSGMPAGASLSTTSSSAGSIVAQFNWVPNFNQAGTYNVQVTANDGFGGVQTSTVQITVLDSSTGGGSLSGLQIIGVELDDDDLSDSSTNFVRDLSRGENFEVKVHVRSNSDIKDAQISASVRGYDKRDEIEDITNVFDMKAGVTYVKKLTLSLPDRIEQDRYKLRVQVEDRDSPTVEKSYELEIDTTRHLLKIVDVVLNPEDEVVAGRAVIATVRVENMGEKDEDGIKVRVSIPELGVSAVDYIDELEKSGDDDDAATSEELFMRIPVNARPGNYQVIAEVSFQDGDELETATKTIRILDADSESKPSDSSEEGKVSITFSSEKQDVPAGSSGIAFPLTFTNTGKTTKVYTVEVEGTDWGVVKVSPSNVVAVKSGETQTVYVFVSANGGVANGERAVVVSIRDTSGAVVKQLSLRANIVSGSDNSTSLIGTRKLLEMGLIALIVILAVIAVIVAFQKMKGDKDSDDEDETSSQTYY